MPQLRSPTRLFAGLVLGMVILGIVLPPGIAQEPTRALRVPSDVDRILRWLPEETETLIVARSFVLEEEETRREGPTWNSLGILLLTQDIHKHRETTSASLLGRQVRCAVFGGMNFEVVSAFGSLRSENGTVIVFEEALGPAAKAWTDDLRREATSVRTVAGREVFVFPSHTVMEGLVQPADWQGTFLVLLEPDTVLCATSDRYLDAMIQRIDQPQAGRAFPDQLPEWKVVDLADRVWMMRHFSHRRGIAPSEGLVARFTPDHLLVSYVPKPDSEVDIEAIQRTWVRKTGDPRLALKRLRIDRLPKGVVQASIGIESADEFAMALYHLQSQDGDED